MRRRLIVRYLLLLALAGCGAGSTSLVSPANVVDTSVQLSWIHSVEFAGLYAVNHRNFGGQAGINLRIDDGGFDDTGQYIDPVARVIGGQSDFGIAGADVLVRARSEGQPVVAIATLYQRSAVALISLKPANIHRPQDLVGKRIGIAPPGTTRYISYQALLKAEEIDPASITEVPVQPQTALDDLFNNKIDVLQTFITTEATQARSQRNDINVILLSDYGIDVYSNVVFTTEAMIAQKPAVVESLVKALSQGLQWSIDHPQDAASHVVTEYAAAMSPEFKASQEAGMLISVPLIKPAGSQPAMMTDAAWSNALQTLLYQKLIKAPVDVTKAYDLSFVKRAYGQ